MITLIDVNSYHNSFGSLLVITKAISIITYENYYNQHNRVPHKILQKPNY